MTYLVKERNKIMNVERESMMTYLARERKEIMNVERGYGKSHNFCIFILCQLCYVPISCLYSRSTKILARFQL